MSKNPFRDLSRKKSEDFFINSFIPYSLSLLLVVYKIYSEAWRKKLVKIDITIQNNNGGGGKY